MGRTAAREISTADTGRQTAVVAAKKKKGQTLEDFLCGEKTLVQKDFGLKKKKSFTSVSSPNGSSR